MLQKKNRQLRAQVDEAQDESATYQQQIAKMRSAARRPVKVGVVWVWFV